MLNGNYVKQGVAAISLAILFPIYWGSLIGTSGSDIMTALRSDMSSLGWMDALFLIIGAIEIYIYLSLINIFSGQLNTLAKRMSLYIMLATIALIHATVLVDVYLAINGSSFTETMINRVIETSLYFSLGAVMVYTLAGIVLSIFLLTNSQKTNGLLKGFALTLLIVCILQLTVFLAFVNIILFPLALVILSVYFLKEPDSVEVV